MRRHSAPDAFLHRSVTALAAALTLTVLSGWTAEHVMHTLHTDGLGLVWLTTFVLLVTQTLLYHFELPYKITPRIQKQLDALHVSIILPAYNEDPGYLRMGLQSFLRQTRPPDSVHVVDDGSKTTDYADVRTWWLEQAAKAGIHTTWSRTPNQGKRHAQVHGVRQANGAADIFITVDSDSCLAPDAVRQVLIPFSRPKVQSVAGIVIATNHRVNLITRITDLWFVTGQLVDRSAMSAMGSVLVNSGPLAAYRAAVIQDNLDSYLNETFFGRPVMFSDDSLLTLYALLRGRTVQQPSAIVFSAMPEKTGHLLRMYLRWMRGSTIRSIWRLRYLPVTSFAYWAHLMRWAQMILSTVVLVWLLAVAPATTHQSPPLLILVIPFVIGWAQGLRYLSIFRSDERMRSRTATWFMMPLAVLWAWTVLRAMRWYGMATCARTGWGTRQNGAEVSLDTAEPHKLLDPHAENTLTLETPLPVGGRAA
ncbi:glycosyltransferase [Streptomyces sp. NPDC008079]|uniref:glycosyltransferase family 2 protein n=1 Tax=Streptomyces sp. NPDC008079 TaxID=3364806 RepID=UPI0036EF0F92